MQPKEIFQRTREISERDPKGPRFVSDYLELIDLFKKLERPGRVRECLQILHREYPDNPDVMKAFNEFQTEFPIYNSPDISLRPPQVLLIGSFLGMNGNVGDEAAAIAVRDAMLKRNPFCSFKLLTRTQPQYLEDDLFSLRELGWAILEDLKRAVKVAIVVGGGVVEPGPTSVQSCLSLIEKKSKIPIVWLGVNADPSSRYSATERQSIKESLQRCDRVIARNRFSQDFLKSLAPNMKIELCADVTLLLKPEESYMNFGFGQAIGLNLRSLWLTTDFITKMADLCDLLIEKRNAKIIFFPFSRISDIDLQSAEGVRSRLRHPERMEIVERFLPPKQMLDAISKIDFMISMRLHPSVFAFANRIPFAGIAYHRKVEDFCEHYADENHCLYRHYPKGGDSSFGTFSDSKFPSADELYEKVSYLMDYPRKYQPEGARAQLDQIISQISAQYGLSEDAKSRIHSVIT